MARTSDLKDEVLKTSIAILNSTGYGSLTITEIADRLGVSKQRIYYHFPGADELVMEVAKQWSESGQLVTIKALANTKENGCFRIKTMAEGMFDWVEEDPAMSKVGLVLYQLAPEIPALRKFMDQARLAGRDRIDSLLKLDSRFSKLKPAQMEKTITALHSHMYGSFFYLVAMSDLKGGVKSARLICLYGLEKMLTAFAEEK